MDIKNLRALLFIVALTQSVSAQLTTNFDAVTAGPVTAADLNAVTTGGTWTFNDARGAVFTIENDGTLDQAFLADDSNGGNAGSIEFCSVELDTPFDLTDDPVEVYFRTATRRTGNGKGLRYTCLDSVGNVAAEIIWLNNGGVTLNGIALDPIVFEFSFPWDSSGIGVRIVSLKIENGNCDLAFGGSSGSAPVLNGATDIARIVVASEEASNQAKGLFLDDLAVRFFDPATPPAIPSFTASQNQLIGDSNIRLAWTTTNTTNVEISPDIGIVATDGTTDVLVDFDSLPLTFTLTATNTNATPPSDTATATVTITAREIVAPPVLMAYWQFDGDLNEEIIGWDTVKVNGPDGFDDIGFASDVPAETAGRVSQSLSFLQLNADDYLTSNFGHVIGSSSRSVSFWAKTTLEAENAVFSYGVNAAGGAFAGVLGVEGDVLLLYRQSASIVAPIGSVETDAWTHIAFVYAGFSGDIPANTTIYVNGVSLGEVGFNNGNPANTVASSVDIGRNRASNGGPSGYAKDLMLSELVFYKGELTPDQVAQLAAGADPANINGEAIPAIAPLPLAASGVEEIDGALEFSFQATEGKILALHESPDLLDFSTILDPTVYSSGVNSSVEIGFDPVALPQSFFRLEDLDLTPAVVAPE